LLWVGERLKVSSTRDDCPEGVWVSEIYTQNNLVPYTNYLVGPDLVIVYFIEIDPREVNDIIKRRTIGAGGISIRD